MRIFSKTKRIVAVILFLSFWGTVLFFAQRLVTPKYQSGIVEGSMIEEYYNEKTKHEVIMIGDCEIYENFSPIELWKCYGITSYIRGSAQQLVWQSYYLLEDTLRYETPKAVVFNVLALKYNEPQKEAYNRMTLDGMNWSFSKYNAIKASMTSDEHLEDYLFPLLRYHSRWKTLTKDDFTHILSKNTVTHNGYYMRLDVKPQSAFPDPFPLSDYSFGDTAWSYLEKMTELCKEKGIELILIKAPTEYPHWYTEWDAQIEEYADMHGLSYINFIPLQNEIGLNMQEDTYDAGLHLNLYGAEKLSRYFGNWLKSNLELTDYRTDENYKKVWDEKTKFYEEEKSAQLKELSEYGKLISYGGQNTEEKETNTMKYFIILTTITLLCLTLIACGNKTEPSKETVDSNNTQNNEQINQGTGQDDNLTTVPTPKNDGYLLTLKNTSIAIDAPMEPIVKSLGEPTQYFESASCAFQGLDKVYTYGSTVIRTYPIDGKDYVLSIQLKDDLISTPEGVCIGDGKEKLTVYGAPKSEDDTAITFEKNGSVLTFILSDGSIQSITYTQA